MNILGYRDFSDQRKIRETIQSSVNYGNENIDLAEIFYFFETSKQRTWFLVTNKRIYIILDDVRKDFIKVNKSYSLTSIYSEDKLNIDIDPNYKPSSGRIFFKKATRGWIYSKKLFPTSQSLYDKISAVIRRVL